LVAVAALPEHDAAVVALAAVPAKVDAPVIPVIPEYATLVAVAALPEHDDAVVAVAALPVQDPELPDTLPVTLPVNGPLNAVDVKVVPSNVKFACPLIRPAEAPAVRTLFAVVEPPTAQLRLPVRVSNTPPGGMHIFPGFHLRTF
jgi:hypothetical protein